MNKTKILFPAIILSSTLTYACALNVPVGKAGDAPSQENSKASSSLAEKNDTTAKSGKTLQIADGKKFKGNIDGKNAIEMTLKRDGANLTGSYFYAKSGSANSLSLRGKVDAKGKFTMQEFDAAGKQTGEFTGTWSDLPYEAGVNISGDWKKPGAKDSSHYFYATEQLIEPGAPEIVTRRISETNKPKHFEISAEYPELSSGANAAKFNQLAKSMGLDPVLEFKKASLAETPDPSMKEFGPSSSDMSYSIEMANEDLICIRFANYEYGSGAAHGNTGFTVLNYDLKNGREIKLADLFKPNSDYLKVIADYAIKDLQNRKDEESGESLLLATEDWAEGAAPTEENYSVWNLTRKGLEITFSPYQVGPYAAGAPSVIIPYAKLKDIAKPDGALAKLMK